jgi:hypothetical protein
VDVNVLAVVFASVAMFVAGAIWYMPIFGNLWGKIHDFSIKSKKEQQEAQKQMMPMLALQFLTNIIMAYALAIFIDKMSGTSPYVIAFWSWLGFALTVQISAVVFGGTKPEWISKKIAVMAGEALIRLMLAALIINAF